MKNKHYSYIIDSTQTTKIQITENTVWIVTVAIYALFVFYFVLNDRHRDFFRVSVIISIAHMDK
jgi:hypothetical protein